MVKFTSALIDLLITVFLLIGFVVIADRLWMWQHMTFSKLAEKRY